MTEPRLICEFVLYESTGHIQPWQRTGRDARSGRVFVPKETDRFQRRVRDNAVAAMTRAHNQPAAPATPVRLEVITYYAWPKKVAAARRALEGIWAPTAMADIDNLYKTVADALQGSRRLGDAVCFANDRQIVDGRIQKRRCDTKEDERMEITVLDLTEGAWI